MAQVSFGPFRLDTTERRLHGAGSVIPLRPKTFAVLDHLVSRPGRLVTKEQLLAAVWPDTAVSDAVLKVCVREIRDALEDDAGHARYVETAHRLGYRFIGQVSVTNLPVALSSLVGRRREVDDISARLGAARLVTLVGAGGCGKSRLALEVAWTLRDGFEDGAWWVDLASFSDQAFVSQAAAVALGVREQPAEDLSSVLARYVSTRDLLLVVDNCEHLAAATAMLLQRLMRAGPRLRVLATSREPLKAEGEHVCAVPSLSIPDGSSVLAVTQALEYDAIRLFDERARACAPSFTLTARNCRAVAEICRQVDGLPLAIELAAARVPAISVEGIASRLGDSLRVLALGRRSDPARHQTLRAAIDWSYDLLEAGDRRLLARLSVFAGGFTLEAAAPVGGSGSGQDADLLDGLSRLIDKSLVFVADRQAVDWRYRLLETVRQYAHEQLVSSDDVRDVVARYVRHYRDFAENIDRGINTADRPLRLAALEREHANLREAMRRALDAGHDTDAARLASALFWFWFHRGYWREGRTFLGAVIERGGSPDDVRARALLGDGVLAWAEGAHSQAAARLQEAVAIGEAHADASTTAHALHFLAMVRLAEGDAPAGGQLAREAVRIARRAADPFCLAIALASHGVALLALESYDQASVALTESVELGRRASDGWAMALPLRNLAIIACRRGHYEIARQLLEESLRGLRDLREKWFLSRSIETLAGVLAAAAEHERAAVLFGAAERLRESVGASVLAFYRADYDRAVLSVRHVLAARDFERSWHLGRNLTLTEMIDYALGEEHVARDDVPNT